jgi:lipopolysaccharide transport system ATP-binding protein
MREAIVDAATSPFRNLRRLNALGDGGEAKLFWALRDVSFEVKHGEILGIVGRNGAGKSTLLKVLSRITEPTVGRVEMNGRVGSLLEVGTGFHPELSGRENVFLNGSILGMDRAYILRQFDEIVEFAGVEEFIDTPVKRYSSGMYLRLAFAVAAFLESEILIVDEVLAVGDAGFQKKCLGKMQNIAQQGRTVLFVSHDTAAITRLCDRIVLLHAGRIQADGPTREVMNTYLQRGLGTTALQKWESANKPGNEIVRLSSARICSSAGATIDSVGIRSPVGLELEYEVLKEGRVLVPNFHLHNEHGVPIFVLHDSDADWRRRARPPGRYRSTAWIPGDLLAEGTVVVGVAISTHDPLLVHVFERDALAFQVIDDFDPQGARGDYVGSMPGIVRPLLHWTTMLEQPMILAKPLSRTEANLS